MKNGFVTLLICLLTACGGGGGGSTEPVVEIVPEEPAISEGVSALVVSNSNSQSIVDARGNLVDLDQSETTIVTDGKKGYSYGFGLVNARDYGQLDAEEDEQTRMAIAGVHPNSDVGNEITSGEVSFDGQYELIYIPTGGESYEPQSANGTVTIKIDLNAGTGGITDDYVSGETTATEGSELRLGDGTVDDQGFNQEVEYQGATGYLVGRFGDEGLVGAMAGEDEAGVFAGGVSADAQ